jgi:putative 2OG-Fe(II) oxygenase
VNIRRHTPGSQGQPLHQDAPGELGLSVLVTEHPTLDGATVFLPGSHQWPIDYSDVGVTLVPRRLRRFLGGATGRPGDVSLFFNRTWHGRYPGDTPATAILMSFFAIGARYPIHEPPPAILEPLHPELRRLLDPHDGVRWVEGNKVVVTGRPGASASDRPELRYALHGVQKAPWLTPWQVVRVLGRARRTAITLVGRERLRHVRDWLSGRATAPR